MTNFSASTRQRVEQRANNRCEYCLSPQDLVMGRLQIDHVRPIVKGGADEEDNLCLACELCNQHKWTKTDGVDTLTGQVEPLFNPRQQKWAEHFTWSPDGIYIVGLTACGRVTIMALKLNNDLAVTVRRYWVQAGWHPPGLY